MPIMKQSEMIPPPLIFPAAKGLAWHRDCGLQSPCHAGVVLICLDILLIISG